MASQITLFVDVPQTEVARIVGAKGANIHRIQDACGCFIRSPPRDAPPHEDGTVSFQLRGKPRQCFEAFEMIETDLGEPVQFGAAEIAVGRPGDVAHLIGPAGATIRGIMHDARVKIITRPREERSDVVVVEGLPKDIERAYGMIFDAIAKAKKEKEAEPYRSSRSVAAKKTPASPSTTTTTATIAASSSEGHQDNQHQEQPQRKQRNSNVNSNVREWGAPKTPKFAGQGGGKREGEEDAKTNEDKGATSVAPSSNRSNPEHTVVFPFPEAKTGMLFGKGGSTIKNIKKRSGAVVFVDTAAFTVRLSGSVESVKTAERMIRKILERTPRPKNEEGAEGGNDEGNKSNNDNSNNDNGQDAVREESVKAEEQKEAPEKQEN